MWSWLAAVAIIVLIVAVIVAWRRVVAVHRARPAAGDGSAIDPFGVGEPWRRFVANAISARRRVTEAVAAAPPGPRRDRLEELAARLDTSVEMCWTVARQGHALDRARSASEVRAARDRLARLDPDADDEATQATRASLQARSEAAERLDVARQQAVERLTVLEARLDEAVARALELSVRTHDDPALGAARDDVESVVADLDALRLALDETMG